MSSNYKVEFLNASYNKQNFRSEFRFPSNMAIKNIRVCNIGLESNVDTRYSENCGALCVIDSIELYDNATLLDRKNHFSNWLAMNNLRSSNSDNQAVRRVLGKNKLGYEVVGSVSVALDGSVSQSVKIVNNHPDTVNDLWGAAASDKERANNGCWLNIADVFDFVDKTPVISTSLFNHLRLVINYKSKTDLSNCVGNRLANVNTLEPFCVFEYESDPQMANMLMNGYRGTTFVAVESDRVILDAKAVADEALSHQEQSYLIKGFNDKYISKMIIQTQPANESAYKIGDATLAFGKEVSESQLNWALQPRVNGANLFPGNLEGKMKRLGLISDSLGQWNVVPGQNWCGLTYSGFLDENLLQTRSKVDYTAFNLEQVVKEFKLTVSRNAVGHTGGVVSENESLRSQVNLYLWGVTRKTVVPNGKGSYVVAYV